MDWCIVLVEMPLIRFAECWISPWTPLKPQHSIPCWLCVQWKPIAYRSCQCCQKKGPSNVCGWICSVWASWVWESQYASTGNSVSWSLGHSSRSSFHRRSLEHQELIEVPADFSKPMYGTRPCCLVQVITRHTCPDPHLGSWKCLPHQAHIAPSEPMSSIHQQCLSLGSFPTFPSPLSPL